MKVRPLAVREEHYGPSEAMQKPRESPEACTFRQDHLLFG